MLAIASRMLAWFIGSVALTLAFLIVPLQVAQEREKLERTNADIAALERSIRALENEFEARSSIAELEYLNTELKLATPRPDQYLSDTETLAMVDFNATQPAMPAQRAGLQLASLVIPADLSGGVAAMPAVSGAAEPASGTATPPAAGEVRTDGTRRMIAVASAPLPRSAPPRPLDRIAQPVAPRPAPVTGQAVAGLDRASRSSPATGARAAPRAVAMLDRQLLSDSTIGDLMSAANIERAGGR